ncbi:MAG: hypothetical protein JWN70_4571 [Planctomycetaceae bacterium]|nr:hypothetical protein [Planctomycetaceae bacterium]
MLSHRANVVAGVAFGVLLNLAPWWLTSETAVVRAVGFPLPVYGRILGYVYREFFDYKSLLADVVFAYVLYWCLTKLVTLGPKRCWRKLRTFGTPLDDDVLRSNSSE